MTARISLLPSSRNNLYASMRGLDPKPIRGRARVVMFKKGEPVIASLVSDGSSYNHNPTSTARIHASALRNPYQRAGENSSLLRATFQLENCQGPNRTTGLLAHIAQRRR